MIRRVAWLLLTVSCLLAGCRPVDDPLGIERIRSVRWHGTAGVDLGLEVENRLRRNLRVEAIEITFYEASFAEPLGRAELWGEVAIPRRSRTILDTRWKLSIDGAGATYLLGKRLVTGEFGRLQVSVTCRVRSGAFRRTFSWERVLLSDFLHTFGVSPDLMGGHNEL